MKRPAELIWDILGVIAIMVILAVWAQDVWGDHPVLRCMPEIESEELREIFADDWTLWFNDDTHPQAMQKDEGPNAVSIHDARHRFNNIDRTTNANKEFPWENGGGLSNVMDSDLALVKFFWHPEHSPVEYFRSRRNLYHYRQVGNQPWEAIPRSTFAWDWEFPIESVVGEILCLIRNKQTFPFEVRTLVKESDGEWQPYIYRQFETEIALANIVHGWGHEELASTIGNAPTPEQTVVDDSHPFAVVKFENFSEGVLPVLPESVADQVLDLPLKLVAYPLTVTATTTQVLPAGYRPSPIGVNREDCQKCHLQVGKSVDEFQTAEQRRDWYGFVRGSDGIFSFPAFDPSCITYNGSGGVPRFNQALINSGHLRERR